MKRFYRNGLFMMAAGLLAASCANYNDIDGVVVAGDPSYEQPYADYAPVKSYIDRSKYPTLTIGTTMSAKEFNNQTLAHAAAITNVDELAFGTSFMPKQIITAKGTMNFVSMKDLLDHSVEIGAKVFGSPIASNANQAEDWIKYLTSPIEVRVDFVGGKKVDYTTMDTFEGTVEKGTGEIVKFQGQNVLNVGTRSNVRIIEGFEVDPHATYTTTFLARGEEDADDVSFSVTFAGNKIEGTGTGGKFTLRKGTWTQVVVEGKCAADETEGYLRIENGRQSVIYVKDVQVGYTPDPHRDQTEKEINDTIHYAMKTWCDALMNNNAGRITSFDLIDDAINSTSELENGMLDLKHSTDKIFWQDIFGSEMYAKKVADYASTAFSKYGGNASDLKFFISESGLDNDKKFESLKYWIDVWKSNGAKIDGINAKVNLSYSENAEKQAENQASIDNLLQKLANTGMMIRISNFDIKYQDATGTNVTAAQITPEQRQNLADYYAYVIKSYMSKIPQDKQAGICKASLCDTSDPVGLWSVNKKGEWVRTVTYKAFCDALSGK